MNGFLRVWLVDTDTPFLISKKVLKDLGKLLDLDSNVATLRELPGSPTVELDESDTEHYFLRPIDFAPEEISSEAKDPIMHGEEVEVFWSDSLLRQAEALRNLADQNGRSDQHLGTE